MPNREMLETYPPFRALKKKLPETLDRFDKPAIKMDCDVCDSQQTFLMSNEFFQAKEYSNYPAAGEVVVAEYVCMSCSGFHRAFVLKIADDLGSVMKIGQVPTWDVRGDPNVEKLLGEHKSYLRRGLICESQGYGIAAFAYYRRIVEETIDRLLDEVPQLLSGADLTAYSDALALTKKTRVTGDKIELVKDLLPAILRPDGMNPLKALHEALSEGLHAESDEECMEKAEAVRQILVFLAGQIAASAEAKKAFTSGMRSFLDKKTPKLEAK